MSSALHRSVYLASIAALSLAAACANVPATGDGEPKGAAALQGDPRLGEKVDRACFASQLDSFSQTGERTVVIEASARKQYLIETSGPCFDLKRAQTIAVKSNLSCVTRGDTLLVSDSAFGFDRAGPGPQRCTIGAIYDWNPRAADTEAGEDPAA